MRLSTLVVVVAFFLLFRKVDNTGEVCIQLPKAIEIGVRVIITALQLQDRINALAPNDVESVALSTKTVLQNTITS